MSILITLALIVLVAQLWRRIGRLEARIETLEWPALPERPAAIVTGDEPWHPPAAPLAVAQPDPAVIEAVPDPIEPAPEPAAADFAIDPDPAPEPASAPAEPRGFGFEELFGRRLPIWAGGITLAVAGMLIVKYSIDAGLVSPLVRVVSGLIFGTVLIAAAELALRAEHRLRDPRVRQALAGAGVASLYGAILIAANVYHLVGPLPAFLGMAAVTALAMGLSLRFGAPSALLGLAGGLAAPALVGSGEANVPLLVTYLSLAVGGLAILSRGQRWMWLGIAALTGGFGWAAFLLAAGLLDTFATLSLGVYILLLGIVLPLVAFGGRLGTIVRTAGSILAAAQMAALVATGGFALLHWGLFGLISAAILWLAGRDPALARLPAVGLAIGLLLLTAWPAPSAADLALVMVAATLLYGLPALRALWRPAGTMVEAAMLAALGIAGLAVPMLHFYRWDGSNDAALAAIGAGAALIPAAAAALGWTSLARRDDSRFFMLASVAAGLLAAAAALALPAWTLALAVGLLGLGLLLLARRADDPRLEISAWGFAAAAVLLLGQGVRAPAEFARLAGFDDLVALAPALARWAGLAAIAGLFAWRARFDSGRAPAEAVAALLAYGAAAQLPLGDYLPLVPALALVAIAFARRSALPDRLVPAAAALVGVCLLWAALPLLHWAVAGLWAVVGQPLLVTSLPSVADALLRLLAPALAIAAAWRVAAFPRPEPLWLAMALGAVAAHVLFKQLWAIDDAALFVAHGLAERIGWGALLFAAAILAARLDRPRAALALSAAGLAHVAWFTLILHNPLFADQAVGDWPVLNLLVPAYGLPLAWLWWLGRDRPPHARPPLPLLLERLRAAAPMLLIALFAFSSLRQLVHGAILTVPGVGAGEDIARSILAIALAIGFLAWGIRTRARDWRLASLAVMIAAVAKVFLLDASGLDGLLRIGSFVALGVSLIGIGWLYSHYLDSDRPDPAPAPA